MVFFVLSFNTVVFTCITTTLVLLILMYKPNIYDIDSREVSLSPELSTINHSRENSIQKVPYLLHLI